MGATKGRHGAWSSLAVTGCPGWVRAVRILLAPDPGVSWSPGMGRDVPCVQERAKGSLNLPTRENALILHVY